MKWHANDTLGHETEVLDFLTETSPPLNFPRPKRYKNKSRDCLETETASLKHGVQRSLEHASSVLGLYQCIFLDYQEVWLVSLSKPTA